MAIPDKTAISRPKPADLIPGYRLEKLVGKGGMGEVHQSVQLSLGRTVAVKLLSTELAKDPTFVARFEKEGAALAALSHPNIVAIVDRGRTDSTCYLVMEFVDGPSLREVMRSPLLESAQSLAMFAQIARAIEYAHGRGVIHRDLKPENILFDEQAGGIAKVTDFGLAGFEDRHDSKMNLTETHMAMGTASYMAPEQQVDARKADGRADIYSLGVLLYELLVGDVPKGSFDLPSTKKAGIDRRVDDIVAKCLKPDADERFQTVTELISQLEPLVPLSSIISRAPTTAWDRFVAKTRAVSKRVLRGAELAVSALALLIIITAFARDAARSKRATAGLELMTEFGNKWPLTSHGRVDPATRFLSLGDGPDTVSIIALGRKPELRGSDIIYATPEQNPTGRAVIDADVEGEGLSVTALVETQELQRSRLEPLKEIFRGPRPDARSALMWVGDPGRYVALVVSGAGNEPTLEWALGSERRGAMTAPLQVAAGTQLELRIDPLTGELSALIGKDRDVRLLGDPLNLGPRWKEAFGETPRAAVGCLEGTCAFRHVVVRGLHPPPLAPLVDLSPDKTPHKVTTPPPPPVRKVSVANKAPPPGKKPPPRRK